MQATGRSSLATVCRGRRSLLGTNSYSRAENRRTRTTATGRNTDHEYHLRTTSVTATHKSTLTSTVKLLMNIIIIRWYF